SDQPELSGPRDRLVAVRGLELAEDAASVGLDGVERDVKRLANLTLRQLGREQAEDVELAIGQLLARGDLAARGAELALRLRQAVAEDARVGGVVEVRRRLGQAGPRGVAVAAQRPDAGEVDEDVGDRDRAIPAADQYPRPLGPL